MHESITHAPFIECSVISFVGTFTDGWRYDRFWRGGGSRPEFQQA